jgi:hypothetical protein
MGANRSAADILLPLEAFTPRMEAVQFSSATSGIFVRLGDGELVLAGLLKPWKPFNIGEEEVESIVAGWAAARRGVPSSDFALRDREGRESTLKLGESNPSSETPARRLECLAFSWDDGVSPRSLLVSATISPSIDSSLASTGSAVTRGEEGLEPLIDVRGLGEPSKFIP